MNPKHALVAGALAAIGASLCCVGPLVLLMLGLGGAWAANLTAMEPLRPVFLGLTLVFLGLAFRRVYRNPQVCDGDKPCVDESTLRRQRLVFWMVAIPLLGLVSFPWFAFLFY